MEVAGWRDVTRTLGFVMESAVVVLQLAGWAWLGGPARPAARPGCSAWRPA